MSETSKRRLFGWLIQGLLLFLWFSVVFFAFVSEDWWFFWMPLAIAYVLFATYLLLYFCKALRNYLLLSSKAYGAILALYGILIVVAVLHRCGIINGR